MDGNGDAVVDASLFNECRTELGLSFIRIVGYFKEDGVKAVNQIELAFRQGDAVAMVAPAHKLKGEAYQLGATKLAELAKLIEFGARKCVNYKETPDELLVHVVKLKPLLEETLAYFERETNPLVTRSRPSFGRAST